MSLALSIGLASPTTAQGPTAADDAIAERMMGGAAPVKGDRVTLWTDPRSFEPEQALTFAAELDKAVPAIEHLTGGRFDSAHYGEPTIHVFVSGRVTISHVYGGYSHASYKRPYLYLHPQRVTRREAPYLHELTHIVLWDFGSHSLREGFASYVEATLAKQGIGYNSGLFGPLERSQVDAAAAAALRGPTGQAALAWIGNAGNTDPKITSAEAPETRQAFYLLARSFVHHLLDTLPMDKFVELYRARDTEEAYRRLTGKSLEDWRRSWLRSLGAGG